MRIKDFKKLKKELTPKKMIYKHIHDEIFLTKKQIKNLVEEIGGK